MDNQQQQQTFATDETKRGLTVNVSATLILAFLIIAVILIAALVYPKPNTAETTKQYLKTNTAETTKQLESLGFQVIASFDVKGTNIPLTGYASLYNGQQTIVYKGNGDDNLIMGTMIGPDGNNLTQAQIAEHLTPALNKMSWDVANGGTNWLLEGSSKSENIMYVFTDPSCPYCLKFWQDMQPLIESDEVQVRNIPVSVISPRSMGAASDILESDDPSTSYNDMMKKLSDGAPDSLIEMHSPLPENAVVKNDPKVQKNNDALMKIAATGTPTIVIKNSDGKISRIDGYADIETVKGMLTLPKN